jgi:hypothetical protein
LTANSNRKQQNKRKQDYRALYRRVNEILYQVDWLALNFGFNIDEYGAEVGRLILRLGDAQSVKDVENILLEEFSYPSANPLADEAELTKTAGEILQAWQEFDRRPDKTEASD